MLVLDSLEGFVVFGVGWRPRCGDNLAMSAL